MQQFVGGRSKNHLDPWCRELGMEQMRQVTAYFTLRLGPLQRSGSLKLILASLALVILKLLSRQLSKALAAVQTYGDKEENFLSFSSFTTLCTSVTTVLCSAIVTVGESREFVPAAPVYAYAMIAVSGAVASAFEAKLGQLSILVDLSWQCFIVFAVMIWQMGILGVKYSWKNWLVSSVFIIGCMASVFSWGSWGSGNSTRWYHTFGGLTLALLYLGMQGLNQTYQEKLFREYNTSVLDQVLFISLITTSINLIAFLTERHVLGALTFFLSHPLSMLTVLLLSLLGAAMTFLTSYMLRLCGALICVMIHQTTVNRLTPGVMVSGVTGKIVEFLGSLVMLISTVMAMILHHQKSHLAQELMDSSKEICMNDFLDAELDDDEQHLLAPAGVHPSR